ncbi:MAG TPA: hypothetical protein ENN83_06265, partial [Rhodovulum sp.]|nr:hypothetical protein [Rhodovulum sp.]
MHPFPLFDLAPGAQTASFRPGTTTPAAEPGAFLTAFARNPDAAPAVPWAALAPVPIPTGPESEPPGTPIAAGMPLHDFALLPVSDPSAAQPDAPDPAIPDAPPPSAAGMAGSGASG